MSALGKVTGTFPLLSPGQTLEKFRKALKTHTSGKPKVESVQAPVREKARVTFHIEGMKKTTSGVT